MSRDESVPIGTVTPEQIAQAKAGAAALDLAEIEARHAEATAARRSPEWPGRSAGDQAHADRGVLLAALREAQARTRELGDEVIRLRQHITETAPAWVADRKRALDAEAEVQRLRGVLEPLVREKAAALALDATREILNAPRVPSGTPQFIAPLSAESPAGALAGITEIGPPGPATQLLSHMAAEGQRIVDEGMAELLSIPVDACDGAPRPGERPLGGVSTEEALRGLAKLGPGEK